MFAILKIDVIRCRQEKWRIYHSSHLISFSIQDKTKAARRKRRRRTDRTLKEARPLKNVPVALECKL